MKDKISKILVQTNALPVLFIGSGLTRRYLNLPDWKGLLKQYCVAQKPFEYYNDKASRECTSNPDMRLPKAADYIEADFNEKWYTDDEYASSRNLHKAEMEAEISPLKICMAEYFSNATSKIQHQYDSEIEQLKKICNKNVSCIITTNYDCFLEECLGKDNFKVFIGQDDLLFSTTYEVGELYKIHGCCTKPESIVINSADYNKMQQKSAYLSSKILTMFLERPIIFLGYGINDADIKQILESISECLENEQLDKLKERLIFVEWNNNPQKPDEISERKLDAHNGKTLSMKNVLLTDYSELYAAILQNKAKYDVRILRRVKSQLYELVKENKPIDQLYIATNIEDDSSEVDFVVGVGVYGRFGDIGYRGIKAEEVFQYVIGQSKRKFNGDMILKEAIPALKNRGILPIFKLIAECKSLDAISKTAYDTFKNRSSIEVLINGVDKKWIEKHGNLNCNSIIEYYKKHGFNKTCIDIPKMDFKKMDADDLKAFILLALSEKPEVLSVDVPTHSYRSPFKKCICIWDFLKYRNDAVKHVEDLRVQEINQEELPCLKLT